MQNDECGNCFLQVYLENNLTIQLAELKAVTINYQ